MISLEGASLIAQILPIAVLIVAFESRDGISQTPKNWKRPALSVAALVTLPAAAIPIVICVVAVSTKTVIEGWYALAVWVPFFIALAGTGLFSGLMLRTMFNSSGA